MSFLEILYRYSEKDDHAVHTHYSVCAVLTGSGVLLGRNREMTSYNHAERISSKYTMRSLHKYTLHVVDDQLDALKTMAYCTAITTHG